MTPENSSHWWQTGIFYNIYVRSFMDSNGDGIGDLTGVIQRLDYLSYTLGVDVIWLSGILASPWKEFGFDVSNLEAIHPAIGTMETFDELLRWVHGRGMKLIIDFIPNHTSALHPWFLESRSSRVNPKRDWYVWRDPKPDGTPPNNWLSLFGGSMWEWDEYTWQYYLHTFLKEQPDLNWRNPAVQQAMFDAARFWLERGVDGFRVDAAHHILKDPELRDNPPQEPREIQGKKIASDYQEHKYDREAEGLHDIFRKFRQLLDTYGEPERIAVAEVHVSGGWPVWAQYYGQNLDEFNFPFNPAFIGLPAWNAQEVRKVVDEIEAALPEGAWPNAHTGNFDEWRPVSRFGEQGARQAAMLLLTMRGVPLLYYGEEIGMTNGVIPPELEKDPMGKRISLHRDPQRTPMQWNPGPHAGFSDHTTAQLWLPVSPNYRQLNVESELSEPRSMLNLYRRLIALRKTSQALVTGSYIPIDEAPEDCYLFLRQSGDQRMLVALNFAGEPRKICLPELGEGEILLNTFLDRESVRQDLSAMELRAQEGVLVRL